jgi:hypothetical protein
MNSRQNVNDLVAFLRFSGSAITLHSRAAEATRNPALTARGIISARFRNSRDLVCPSRAAQYGNNLIQNVSLESGDSPALRAQP